MPRASKKSGRARQAGLRLQVELRIKLAERECRRAEKVRNEAQAAVRVAYVELGRALLASELGAAFKPKRGRW